MYNFGEKFSNGECLSLKQSSDFELREGSCEKEKSFICLWTAPECPEDYYHVGQLSDGRTCHAIFGRAESVEKFPKDLFWIWVLKGLM